MTVLQSPYIHREYKYDNYRFLLIVLVIIGHGMELFLHGPILVVYKIMYTFHIPAFLFISGKFAKSDNRNLTRHFVLPYLLFQTLYLCFDAWILKEKMVELRYTTPYWLLWYLMTMSLYYLLLPWLPERRSQNGYIVVVGSILLSLLCGYEKTVGTFLSLSRTIVFSPFFFAGYYIDSLSRLREKYLQNMYIKILLWVICVMSIGVGLQYSTYISEKLLYGAYSYADAIASIEDRFIIILAAYSWIYLLYIIMPKTKIPLITTLGQNTMPIYLCHGFVIRLLRKANLFHYSMPINLMLLCICTVAILAMFGNNYVKRFFAKLF